MNDDVCGMGCAAGRNLEMLLCGLSKGHKGDHAWASLPTFVGGRSTGPDSFEAGLRAAAKWLKAAPVQPPDAAGHWKNAGFCLEKLFERGDIAPEVTQDA